MKTLRYAISVICALGFLAITLLASGGNILFYVDIPSAICVFGLSLALLRSGWSFREMGHAFASCLTAEPRPAERAEAEVFFRSMRRYLYASAALGVILGLIAIFVHFKDGSRFFANLGVCLIVVFYALLGDILVALPFLAMAKRPVKD